jgi:hypothetical protein
MSDVHSSYCYQVERPQCAVPFFRQDAKNQCEKITAVGPIVRVGDSQPGAEPAIRCILYSLNLQDKPLPHYRGSLVGDLELVLIHNTSLNVTRLDVVATSPRILDTLSVVGTMTLSDLKADERHACAMERYLTADNVGSTASAWMAR